MHTINFDNEALRFLEKNKIIAKRIWNKLQETKIEPHHYFTRLTGRTDYKLRVGDYRIIADIDNNNKIIQITHIGHRKNIYDTKK